MANYEDDDLDEVDSNEEVEVIDDAGEESAAGGGNRNFLLALGILGGIFVLLIIGLVILFLSRRPGVTAAESIEKTNAVIFVANTQTAGAATQVIAQQQTNAAAIPPTFTAAPPTATNTQVVAIATATSTAQAVALGVVTATPSPTVPLVQTGTVPAALTLAAGQTQTRVVVLTATNLPNTGFADEVGLPGLFGLALGLVVVIVLVRRLRLSTNG